MRGHPRRGVLLALSLLGWAGVGGVLFVGAPAQAATHAGHPIAAWWNAANQGNGLPTPPTYPDVKGHQLLVQGSNATPSLAKLSKAPSSSQAVAAIRWTVPAGRTAESVHLRLAGSAPSQLSAQACQVTGPFTSVYGGPYSQVPATNCSHPVDSSLKGSDLVFTGVQSLVRGRTLSLLIRPGPLDRVVLAPPTAASLRSAKASTSGAPAGPPLAAPNSTATGTAGHQASQAGGAPAVSSAGGGAVGTPSGSGGAPPTVAGSGPAPAGGQAPQVAGSNGSGAPPSTATAPTAAQLIPAAGWRRLVAGLIVAAEVLVFALLHLRRRDPTGDPIDKPTAQTRGVGRFAMERTEGPVPLM